MSTPGIYGPEDNFLLDLQCSNLGNTQSEDNPMTALNDKTANTGMQSSAFVDDTDIMCKPMIQQQVSLRLYFLVDFCSCLNSEKRTSV